LGAVLYTTCCGERLFVVIRSGADPASEFRGAISEIFGSQVSLRVLRYKRDDVYFTTLLWQNSGRQNGLASRMLFSELYKIIVNKITFVRFRGNDRPSPWIRPSSGSMQHLFL